MRWSRVEKSCKGTRTREMVRMLRRRGETGGWRRRCWAMRRVGKRTEGVHLEVADLNELRGGLAKWQQV